MGGIKWGGRTRGELGKRERGEEREREREDAGRRGAGEGHDEELKWVERSWTVGTGRGPWRGLKVAHKCLT